MRICKIGLTVSILLLLAGCLATSYDTAMRRDPVFLPNPEEVTPTPTAGAIWAGANSFNLLFTDRKARNIGDVVTIVVDENSQGANNAYTEAKRDSTTAAGIAGFVNNTSGATIIPSYSIGGTSNYDHKGTGQTNRDGSLKGRISARVVRVLPNGNFVIEGRRMLTVNAEDQFMVITGMIRPDDITTDNLVNSQYIADARIVYTGKGVVDEKMRPGWGTRVLDWVWPF
ncbi:MAG TPA: flagellar basal body L-ring protein FlgH [Syntrophales bacterium]|nr:flagellar basal body L-ring protein FlgH [Syntrophales bacterium]